MLGSAMRPKPASSSAEQREHQADRQADVEIHGSPEDDVEDQRERQDDARPASPGACARGRPRPSAAASARRPGRVSSSSDLRCRVASETHDRGDEAGGEGPDRGPEVLRHLARVGVHHRASQPPLIPTAAPRGQRQPVVDGGRGRARRAGRRRRRGRSPAARTCPSRNVANSGAFTNANTSCRTSMMLLNFAAPCRRGDAERRSRRRSPARPTTGSARRWRPGRM